MNKSIYIKMRNALAAMLLLALAACDNEPELIVFEGPHFAAFERASANLLENNEEPVALPVIISTTFDQAVTIPFTVDDNNAISGADYEIVGGNSVTIPAGSYKGEILVRALDNNVLDDARSITITLVPSEGQLEQGAEASVTVAIVNDDCPVNTGLWAGSPIVTDVGYSSFAGSAGPNANGDCNVLVFTGTDFPGGGLSPLPITLTFVPDFEGAQTGNVIVPKQDMYEENTDYAFEGVNGRYDETGNTPTVTFDYIFYDTDGSVLWTGATVIEPGS